MKFISWKMKNCIWNRKYWTRKMTFCKIYWWFSTKKWNTASENLNIAPEKWNISPEITILYLKVETLHLKIWNTTHYIDSLEQKSEILHLKITIFHHICTFNQNIAGKNEILNIILKLMLHKLLIKCWMLLIWVFSLQELVEMQWVSLLLCNSVTSHKHSDVLICSTSWTSEVDSGPDVC